LSSNFQGIPERQTIDAAHDHHRQAIRQGNFGNVKDHIAVIRRFNDGYHDRCRSLIWTKDVDTIIAKAKRSPKTKDGAVI
jgi:hypothetical protein